MSLASRARALLAHPRLPLSLALLAVLLGLPAVRSGFILDDYVLRAVALGRGEEVGLTGSPLDLFSFFSDAPGARERALDAGWSPWWAAPDLRVRFFRPLSSLTHFLDMRLMPDAPLPMHVENLVLYALVVIVAFAFYRRFLGATWVAGLAASLYALDPGHAQSAGLIAGRNTLLAPLFGMLAVIHHDRARRDGDRGAGLLGVALLVLSMLSGESGLSTLLYLLAYALFFDPAPTPSLRLRALAPHLALACAYVGVYKHLDFGARASGMYCDPGHDTAIYLHALPVRAPIYLLGLLGLPPASIFAALSRPAAVGLAVAGAAFLVLLGLVLRPLLRRDPVARFFACGALLSVLPIASIIPNDRVLFFAGLGAFGLVAQLVSEAFAGERRGPRVMAWALLTIHLPLALLLFPASAYGMNLLARSSREPLDAILLEPEVRDQTAILVNPPAQFMVSHLAAMRVGTSRPLPKRARYLAPGIYPLTIVRLSDHALSVRAEGGLLQPSGTRNVPGEPPSPPLHPSYGSQYFAEIMRRSDIPMHAGEKITMPDVQFEVTEVDQAGHPIEIHVTFTDPLGSPSLRFFRWDEGKLVPFVLPATGERVTLPAVAAM